MIARLRLGALVLAVLTCTACWQTRQGPEPPDLRADDSEVAQTVERLESIETALRQELDAFQTARDKFFDEDPSAWGRPFPLDSFKHAAMSCLNQPYSATEPEPAARQAAAKLGIHCPIEAAVVLERRLDDTPSVRDFALRKLREIDQVRERRARVQSRLRQLPQILRSTRNYLATRRAEARQTEKDVRRRKPEYTRKNFAEAIDRINRYQAQLDALQKQIDHVQKSIDPWSKELGNLVDGLYKSLSRLGR